VPEEEGRGRRLRTEANEVGADHHRSPWQAIGPDAAGHDERGPAERVGGENHAEPGGAAADPEHGERNGYDHERVAQRRPRARDPEQPERPLRQRAESICPRHGVRLRLRARNRGFRLSSWT
jgi:hypothetical protein